MYANQNTKYANQNTKYANQNTKYANQNTKYANKYLVRQSKHQVRQTKHEGRQPRHQLCNLNQKSMTKTSIDLRCFVARQFLLRIYALCWRTFCRLKKYGGVPKMTNMTQHYCCYISQ